MYILNSKYPWIQTATDEDIFYSVFEEITDEEKELLNKTTLELSRLIDEAESVNNRPKSILFQHILARKLADHTAKKTNILNIATIITIVLAAIIGPLVTYNLGKSQGQAYSHIDAGANNASKSNGK